MSWSVLLSWNNAFLIHILFVSSDTWRGAENIAPPRVPLEPKAHESTSWAQLQRVVSHGDRQMQAAFNWGLLLIFTSFYSSFFLCGTLMDEPSSFRCLCLDEPCCVLHHARYMMLCGPAKSYRSTLALVTLFRFLQPIQICLWQYFSQSQSCYSTVSIKMLLDQSIHSTSCFV